MNGNQREAQGFRNRFIHKIYFTAGVQQGVQVLFIYCDANNGRLEALREARRYAAQKRTCRYARSWMWGLVFRTANCSEVTFLATTKAMKIPSWARFSLMIRISTVRTFFAKGNWSGCISCGWAVIFRIRDSGTRLTSCNLWRVMRYRCGIETWWGQVGIDVRVTLSFFERRFQVEGLLQRHFTSF